MIENETGLKLSQTQNKCVIFANSKNCGSQKQLFTKSSFVWHKARIMRNSVKVEFKSDSIPFPFTLIPPGEWNETIFSLLDK